MRVKIFFQPSCPHCPKVKRLGKILKKEGIEVEFYNVQEVNGLAEATFFSILSTPSIVLTEGNKEIASWRGKIPTKEEIKKYFKRFYA